MPPLVMIFAWPLISAVLFRKYTIPVAMLATIFGGYLLLPPGIAFELPLVPTLNKDGVPALAALACAMLILKSRSTEHLPGLLPRYIVPNMLVLGVLMATAFMVLTNMDILRYGPRVFAGLRAYDAISVMLAILVTLVPLALGRKFFASPERHRLMIYAFIIAGLCYSLPALFEARMSPQLNRWVYGFFPHQWLQHVRGNGWRPIVFLEHGLLVSLFFSMTVIAAVGSMRLNTGRKGALTFAAVWLFLVLIITKSLGALVIALCIAPAVLFLTPRMHMICAAVICAIFLTYPVLRGAGLFPINGIENMAAQIDPERAASLRTRLDNEQKLLDKAAERPVFGWGIWGRWRVYDDATGRDITISDGYWVITIAQDGWAGYVFKFGLLMLPIFLILLRSRQKPPDLETSVLSLILAANIIDLIPNAGITPLTWLISGALWGRLELGAGALNLKATEVAAPVRQNLAYSSSFEPAHAGHDRQRPLDPKKALRYARQTKPTQRTTRAPLRFQRKLPPE